MNCKNIESLLSAYVDEELSGREMLEIREHISGCHACQEELRMVETVKQVLGGSPIPEPSLDFEDRLVSSVLAATAPSYEPKRVSVFTLTGIAAASMLGTLLLINSIGRTTSSPVYTESRDEMAYEMIQRDQAFSVSANPLDGGGVMPASFDGR